jgi:hypothetical protein
MAVNLIGLAAAITAFLGIWLGHVAVRKIEFISPAIWIPSAIFACAGAAAVWGSLLVSGRPASAVLGILGITLLWDALEFVRQQRRVQKGHAPANPRNPRHAQILASFPSATEVDLLKREPAGREVGMDEAIRVPGARP